MDLICRRFISVSTSYVGNNFWTVEEGVRKATPLLLTLAVVEMSDVVFAIDSIPAVCLVTFFICFSVHAQPVILTQGLEPHISGGLAVQNPEITMLV